MNSTEYISAHFFGLYWTYSSREQKPNMEGEAVDLGLQQKLQFYVLN